MNSSKHIKTVSACFCGAVLEWYDFSLFGAMAPILANKFFYTGDQTTSLLLTFATFASGFLMRPIGGLFFGQAGDKRGRKSTLSITIIMMAIATSSVGLLPGYTRIGIYASILITLMRLLQGLSVSGEYPTAIALLAETAPPNRKALFSSFSVFGTVGGILLGTIVVYTVTNFMTEAAFNDWGWRIPFLLSIPLGFLGIYLRRKISESAVFDELSKTNKINKYPIIDVLKQRPERLIAGLGVYILSNVAFYTIFIYLSTYLVNNHQFDLEHASLICSLNMALLFVLTPCVGYLADYFDKHLIMLVGAIGLVVGVYPLFYLAISNPVMYFHYAQMILAILLAIFIGPIAVSMSDLFPAATRVSGLSYILNIASVFGGFSPLAATYFLHRFENPVLSCSYFLFWAAVAVIALMYIKRKNIVYRLALEY